MLERETDLIIQTIAARTIGPADSLSLKEFLAADIPRGVKAYTSAEVVRWLDRDLHASPALSRLDAGVPGLAQLSRGFLRSVAPFYVFPRSDLMITIDNAVHFLENYLCRPQWTLENFIFEQNPGAPVSQVRAKLEYLAEFAYYRKLLERVIQQRGWREVLVEDFRSLVIQIDDQVVKQHDPRELALLVKPMFDFLLLCDAPHDAPIPLRPVLVFLEDKKLKILKEYIEDICRIRGRAEITLDELTRFIEDLYLGQPSAQEPARAQVPPPAPAPDAFPEGAGHPRSDLDRKNVALSLTFAGMQEGQPTETLPDLNSLIPEEQRSMFIRKIFMKDEDYYGGIITALNNLHSWKDATQYLNQLFEINNLDPFAAEVIEFTDAVQKRFTPGQHGGT